MLMEMQVSSLLYTWIGEGERRTQSKLDSVFINIERHQKLGNAEVRGLPRVLSDHIPLIINTTSVKKKVRLFRYGRAWQRHGDFKNLVMCWWSEAPTTSFACLTLSSN